MELSEVKINLTQAEERVLRQIGSVADELSLDCYLIGGYVRDKLLGRECVDIDVVCIGDAILLATKVAKKLNVQKPTIFKRFGTAMIKYNGFELEFVGARKESYSIDSRKPIVQNGSLEDDQKRRDFTINALAFSLNTSSWGKMLDPFEGLKDLSNGVIRTPLEPDQTFSDDPLRMLRAIRFATQLHFEIHPLTIEGIKNSANRIEIVSQERITTELNKIVKSAIPSVGFQLLHEVGLIELIFPAMAKLRGVDYVDGKGHKDNYFHTIQVLDNVAKSSNDLWLRWAAIMHDIGKPKTKRYNNKVGWTFHGHDAVGAGMTPGIFRKLKLPLDHKMKYVQKLVRLHLRPISLTKENITDSAIRRLIYDAGDDVEDLMTLCEADITTKNERKQKKFLANYKLVKQKMIEIEEKDQIRNWQPPISGEEIMKSFGIGPCREVGMIKNAIKEAILDGVVSNSYEDAHSFMLTKAKEMGISK